MLVISRKVGEQVLIPQLNITVTVVSVGRNRIQLGIKAPRELDITRPDSPKRRPDQAEVRPSPDTDHHAEFASYGPLEDDGQLPNFSDLPEHRSVVEWRDELYGGESLSQLVTNSGPVGVL